MLATGLIVDLPPDARELARRVLEATRAAAGQGTKTWIVELRGLLYVQMDGGKLVNGARAAMIARAAKAARAVVLDAGVHVDELADEVQKRRRGRPRSNKGPDRFEVDQVLNVIRLNPGLRCEQISKIVGHDAKAALAELRAGKKVQTLGTTRAMTYSVYQRFVAPAFALPGLEAAAPSRTEIAGTAKRQMYHRCHRARRADRRCGEADVTM